MCVGLDLSLHPQHLQLPGRLCPLRGPSPAPDRAERLRELDRRAERAFEHRAGGEPPAELRRQVRRTHDHLVLSGDDGMEVRVPFLLAEVGYAQRDFESIVAFGTCLGEPQEYEVWLIVVAGGEAALRTFLHALSKGGVVRGDVEKECSVPAEPFASGGSSRIYRARRLARAEGRRRERGREMAAKALSARHASDAARVDHEVRMLFEAQGHPNVICFRGLFCCGPDGSQASDGGAPAPRLAGKAVLLTDYLARGCLWSCVRRGGTFPEGEAFGLVAGVMSALAHIHGKGIVHRDVKSENVLLGADGRAILTDFGIACLVTDAKAMQKRCGTPGYSAPEQVSSDSHYGKKVDVFGAGVTLYFTLYACTPFGSGNGGKTEVLERTKECNVTFPDHRAVTARSKRVLQMLLAKDPEDRPSSTMALQVIELVGHAQPCQSKEALAPASLSGELWPRPSPANSPRLREPADSAEAPLQPVPPATSPGSRRRMPALLRRTFSKASPEQEAPAPLGAAASPGARPAPCWEEKEEEQPGTSSTRSRNHSGGHSPASSGGSAASSRSGSLSPGWPGNAPAKASSGPRSAFVVPSMDRICPAFLKRRRSKAMDGVVP